MWTEAAKLHGENMLVKVPRSAGRVQDLRESEAKKGCFLPDSKSDVLSPGTCNSDCVQYLRSISKLIFNANSFCGMLGKSVLPRTRSLVSAPLKLSRRKFTTEFWQWTTQSRPSWRENYQEAAVVFVVFGVTGSTSVAVVRPFLKYTIGLEGSLYEGPNSYRALSIILVSPIYACMLVTFGTLSGRHSFFANMARKILGRFMPSSVLKKVTCPPAQQKFDSVLKK